MSKLKLIIFLAILFTLVRAGIVYFERISPEEAYYVMCAAQPAPAYFDGPAGTALTMGRIELWSSLAGRLSAPLWALAATLACFFLVRRLAGEVSAMAAALVLNAIPAFNIFSLRIGPELPALTFILLALYAGWRGFEQSKGPDLLWWTLSGLFIGAATFFLYAALAVAPALACFLWSSRKHRDAAGLVLGFIVIVVPCLTMLPALQWNAAHDWIPIAGGTLQTVWQFGGRLSGTSLLETIYLLSPVLGVGLLLIWFLSARGARTHVRTRFVFIGALPGLVMGFYAWFRGEPAAFYFLMSAPLLLARAGELIAVFPMGHLWARIAVVVAIIFSILAGNSIVSDGSLWPETAAQVRQLFFERLDAGEHNLFLIAETPPMASVIGYYLKDELIPPPGHPAVYVQASQDISSQYSLWPGYDDFIASDHSSDEYFTEQKGENPFMGRDALYVTRETPDNLPQAIKGAFESVAPTGQVIGSGKDALYIYRCVNYQTLPL